MLRKNLSHAAQWLALYLLARVRLIERSLLS